MDRIAMMKDILSQNPRDSFARYGLAMEYANSGKWPEALDEFETLLKEHPDYTAGYFMAAQTLSKVGKTDEARQMLTRGIASAERTNNAHAKSEMDGMLAELG